MMMYLSLAAGLVVLLLCGDLLVRGAAGLAERAGLSPLIIALTVVALGTSMPELVVSVSAALQGSPDIALGNVVGSNIANILLVLGLPAMLYPIVCSHHALRLNTAFMLAASGLLIAFCLVGPLTRGEGQLLLVALGLYLVWSGWDATRYPADAIEQTVDTITKVEHMPRLTIAGLILVGCIGLPIGAARACHLAHGRHAQAPRCGHRQCHRQQHHQHSGDPRRHLADHAAACCAEFPAA